jgi:sulfide:quinone oxidoreductase
MRHLVILGAGTAGTTLANKLRARLAPAAWRITVVDRDDDHHYQPGYLFVPFGRLAPERLVRSRRGTLRPGIDLVIGEVDRVVPEERRVVLTDGELTYDQLVIATGTHPRPDQTPGLDLEDATAHGIHSFYTLEGATALREALARFDGGRLVVQIVELPIKCPVAPLEFSFLVDAWLRERGGLRDRTELVYVTPLDGAFTKPIAAQRLGGMLDARGIVVEADFALERVDVDPTRLVSYDEREVPFDLLVTVPVNMGAPFVGRSGLGDDLDHVKVDPHTFLAAGHDDIFAIGDAANLPTSKAGSVAHFSVDVFIDNFDAHVAGRPLPHRFDGHANCFVESGDGKALLLDFNYDTEPLPGTFPFPRVGPLTLLGESRINHLGKLGFEWVYWHALLPGRPLPFPTHMPMAGKQQVPA